MQQKNLLSALHFIVVSKRKHAAVFAMVMVIPHSFEKKKNRKDKRKKKRIINQFPNSTEQIRNVILRSIRCRCRLNINHVRRGRQSDVFKRIGLIRITRKENPPKSSFPVCKGSHFPHIKYYHNCFH